MMLATIIQRYNKKKSFHFNLKFYRLSDATFYNCINSIYQLKKPFFDNKMSIFEEYGAFKGTGYTKYTIRHQHENTPI